MTTGDYDWLEMAGNLSKARNIWMKMTVILSREGADPKESGLLFKAVVQVVLLFGAEMWVLTPRMEQALRSFQHRAVKRLTGKKTRRRGERRWEYTMLVEEMEKTGFEDIGSTS